jgi:hypothetical protein
MWWKRSKSDASLPAPPPAAASTASADIAELRRELRALQGQLTDLDDRHRRFVARARKRWSVDEAEEAAPAGGAAAAAPTHNGKVPSAAQLRASGRWPLR